MEERIVTCTRKTKETDISLTLNLDGSGKTDIHTGIGFFDHMLDGFARHGLFDLSVSVKGDLEVDCHHTMEISCCRWMKRLSSVQLIFPEDRI